MGGDPMEVYLMVTTEDNYHATITGPNEDRNAAIQNAMGMGHVGADAQEGLQTYAAAEMNIETNVDHNPIR